MNKINKWIVTFAFLFFSIGLVFANVDEINIGLDEKLIYITPNYVETEFEFKFNISNRSENTLPIRYESINCEIELPDVIRPERITVRGWCKKSENIQIFIGENRRELKIKIIEIPIEPPEIPDEPEEPINTIKISNGRNLTQEGINKYGKENFYHILNRISVYSKEFKLNNFYWKNSNTYDICFLYEIKDNGQKVYKILESIKL